VIISAPVWPTVSHTHTHTRRNGDGVRSRPDSWSDTGRGQRCRDIHLSIINMAVFLPRSSFPTSLHGISSQLSPTHTHTHTHSLDRRPQLGSGRNTFSDKHRFHTLTVSPFFTHTHTRERYRHRCLPEELLSADRCTYLWPSERQNESLFSIWHLFHSFNHS